MILLEFGANIRTIQVRDNVTIPNPEYLFIFINDNTYKKVACTASETIVDDYRSTFTITVQASGDGLNSAIALDDLGFYHYYIYQKTAAEIAAFDYVNVDSIDIRTVTGLLTDGKMKYSATPQNNNFYKDVRTSVKSYGT